MLLNQFFHPDLAATAQIATDLAEDLVADGFEVTALAARGSYLGGGRLTATDVHRGVRIVRVRCASFGKRSVAGRVADYATYFVSALYRTLSIARPDIVVGMSTPPLVAAIAALSKALRGTRFVYWLQDVYPELAIELGMLRAGSIPARVLEAGSRWTLRRADQVVVLGEAMASRVLAKGVPRHRVQVIPNWADPDDIRPIRREENAFRREHGLDGKRVVLYSGNMGRGHDLATILDVARALRGDTTVVFVFIGEGAKRAEVEGAARELPNVRLLPYQPRERLAESLSSGDVHVVTQDACTVGLIEPSKLYGVLAAGRPVLYVGPSGTESARTILAEGAGAVVANGDVGGARDAVEALLARSEPIGARARERFVERYSRRQRTASFAALLRDLAPSTPPDLA